MVPTWRGFCTWSEMKVWRIYKGIHKLCAWLQQSVVSRSYFKKCMWCSVCMPEMNEWVPSSSFQHIKPFCCNTYIYLHMYKVCFKKKSCIKRLALVSNIREGMLNYYKCMSSFWVLCYSMEPVRFKNWKMPFQWTEHFFCHTASK